MATNAEKFDKFIQDTLKTRENIKEAQKSIRQAVKDIQSAQRMGLLTAEQEDAVKDLLPKPRAKKGE